jgi:hypothetical protein
MPSSTQSALLLIDMQKESRYGIEGSTKRSPLQKSSWRRVGPPAFLSCTPAT